MCDEAVASVPATSVPLSQSESTTGPLCSIFVSIYRVVHEGGIKRASHSIDCCMGPYQTGIEVGGGAAEANDVVQGPLVFDELPQRWRHIFLSYGWDWGDGEAMAVLAGGAGDPACGFTVCVGTSHR